MSERVHEFGMGWLPDLPDFRDFTAEQKDVAPMLATVAGPSKTTVRKTKPTVAPKTMDLRPWCSPIENQGSLGSCTANAGVGLVEYFEFRAFGRYLDASRLFLYKATRDLLGWTGDSGAHLRTTMAALVLFGVPPEKYWPYDVARFDQEPSGFCYAFAQNYQAIKYYRLDTPGLTPTALLQKIKAGLRAGLPAMFGFTVYHSYTQAGTTGKIPFPCPGESVVGGHAVVAVGYDDAMKIANGSPGGGTTTGALLIRNSWGTGWGSAGYGWLPYEYVLRGQATDWWSLMSQKWVDTGVFGG